MKFDNLTPEHQEMFMESHFNEGSSVEYSLFWVWDWDTLELITEDSQGFIEVHTFNSEKELAEVLKQLDNVHREWLDGTEEN